MNAWARTIGARAALRWARSSRRHLSTVDPEGLLQPHSETSEPQYSDRVPRKLEAYLDALPPRQREALVLRHALGYTVPEIAELLETSVNTIKSRLLQARKDVRRHIRRDELVAATRRNEGAR